MSSNTKKYPAFDLLEVQSELQQSFERYTPLQPVQSGAILPELLNVPLTASQQTLNATHQSLIQSQALPYLDKVLMVYFYSSAWQQTSLEHLKQLNALRHEVRYNDGKLLIVNADEDATSLQQLLWEHNLQLTAYHDPENKITGIFKVFDVKSPAWSRYAGVDSNVPLPSVFVLDHFLRVIFDHSNADIEQQLPMEQLISAVYQGNNHSSRRSA